jgi:3-hydroxybutyryl-CoA dehydratase
MRLRLGLSSELTRRFSRQDVADYVALGGAPVPNGAVPEPLVSALFSCLLGERLPGPGTNYLKQETEFAATARVGQPLTGSVTVTRLRPPKRLVDLETICRDDSGELICRGRALVRFDPPAGWE